MPTRCRRKPCDSYTQEDASYPQDTFSVKVMTMNRKTVIFKENKDNLIHKNSTKFKMLVDKRLYYLMNAENNTEDNCQGCYDIHTWHKILDTATTMISLNYLI